MTTCEEMHMPHVWQCQDCNQYGNDSRKCWACASTVVWPVGKRIPHERLGERAA